MIYILDLLDYYGKDENRKSYFLLFPYHVPPNVQNFENLELTYRKNPKDDSCYEIRYADRSDDIPRHLRNYWFPEYDENSIYELMMTLDLEGRKYMVLEVGYRK